MVVIHSAAEEDRESLSVFLKANSDIAAIQIVPDNTTSERFSRSLVACSGDRIVGYGSVFSRWLHPQRLRMEMYTTQDSAQNQVRDGLISHLILCIPRNDTRDLQASYWQSDLSTHAFWDARGFSLLMRTHIGTLDPGLVAVDHEDLHVPLALHHVQIVSGAEIDSDSPVWDEIALLHEVIYRQNHAWNVPVPINMDLARDLFLQPADLIPEKMHIALESGRPVAVASLRPSTQAGHCELGWIGIHDEYSKGRGIVSHLLSACLSDARRRHWMIDVEIDEADPILAPMLDIWPLQDLKTWVTVSRPRPPP